jgi:hypothetical protein
VLGPHATTELNRFVVRLALPALLFDITAHTGWAAFYQPGFLAAYGLSSAIVFAATVALRLRRPRHLADASIDGLNAGYSNAGFIGFPLCLAAFGPASMAATTIGTILTVCVLFGIGIVLIETGLQTEAAGGRLVLKVLVSLASNPLLFAPALGAVLAATGLTLPASAESFLKLLGGAASPCALVALGLFLAQSRDPGAGGGEAAAASGARLGAGGSGVPAAATAHPCGGRAGRPADRHRPVHAGGVLPPRGRHHLERHPALDHRLGGDRFAVSRLDRRAVRRWARTRLHTIGPPVCIRPVDQAATSRRGSGSIAAASPTPRADSSAI